MSFPPPASGRHRRNRRAKLTPPWRRHRAPAVDEQHHKPPNRHSVIRVASVVVAALVLGVSVHQERGIPALFPSAKIDSAESPRRDAAPGTEPAETYQERQQRISDLKDPLLKPLDRNKGEDTICVSSEFTTLSVVYESIVESLIPSLPAHVKSAVRANNKAVQQWMATVHVSTLAVSDHPEALGADQDDPQYRTPLSQLVVNNLLKIRDGKQSDAIPVKNITLSQAVESAWLYFFVGVLAPIHFGLAIMPGLGSPFSDAGPPVDALAGFLTYNTLLSLGFAGTQLGLQFLYQGTGTALRNQCVARVTAEQKDEAGKPSDKVRFNIPIHPLIQGAANQLALADSETCSPVGDQPLGRIVERTGEAAKASAPDAATKHRINGQVTAILRQMNATKVPHNLIPADPADFNQFEALGSFIGRAVPYVGGAPLDVIIGLGHNSGRGKNMHELVSLDDLTVTKSLTAAYYSYALSLYLFQTVGGLLIAPIPVPGAEDVTVAPVRMIGAVLGLPLTYGLVTFHHVIRSMCFVEDDKTGTGVGAEANKSAPNAHAEAVEGKTGTPASPSTPAKPSAPRTKTSAR